MPSLASLHTHQTANFILPLWKWIVSQPVHICLGTRLMTLKTWISVQKADFAANESKFAAVYTQ